MAGTKLISILPLLLIIAASMQAQALKCYQCEDCEDYKKYEKTLDTCPSPELASATAPASTVPPTTTPAAITTTATDATTEATTPTDSTLAKNRTTEAAIATTATTQTTIATTATTQTSIATTATTQGTTQETTSMGSTTLSRRRRRAAEPELKSPLCATITYKDGDETKIKRQCSYENQSVDEKTRCASLSKNFTNEAPTCKFCDTDKCNSATKLTVASTIFTMIGLILTF